MTRLADLPQQMHNKLSLFEYYRRLYDLSPSEIPSNLAIKKTP